MPISAYFSGHGNEVMRSMKGNKREFYATANKMKQNPPGKKKKGKKKKKKSDEDGDE